MYIYMYISEIDMEPSHPGVTRKATPDLGHDHDLLRLAISRGRLGVRIGGNRPSWDVRGM